MVGRIWLAAGTVGAALVLVPAAYAQKPQCPSAKLTGPMNTAISLASLTCTNVSSNFTVNPPSPPPQHGDLSGPPYQYTPKPGYHGTDQFKYTVTDNTTHETSDPATVDLLIDSAPTCKDLSITTA